MCLSLIRERVRVYARGYSEIFVIERDEKGLAEKIFLTFFAPDRGHLPKSVLVIVKGFFSNHLQASLKWL